MRAARRFLPPPPQVGRDARRASCAVEGGCDQGVGVASHGSHLARAGERGGCASGSSPYAEAPFPESPIRKGSALESPPMQGGAASSGRGSVRTPSCARDSVPPPSPLTRTAPLRRGAVRRGRVCCLRGGRRWGAVWG